VDGLLIESNGQSVHTTISLGVTTLQTEDRDLDDLFRKADQALYTAKGAGKNRFEAV
jgi:diguanylate cyclase (GGDEF)-like protein